jgi:hypothetical protein
MLERRKIQANQHATKEKRTYDKQKRSDKKGTKPKNV